MSKPDGSTKYYTPMEAAAMLKVDRRTVYEWIRKGKLKAVKFGDSWRIPASEIEPKDDI